MKKIMKNIALMLILIAAVFMMTACNDSAGTKATPTAVPQAAQQQKTEAPAQETAQQTGEVHGLEAPIAEKPILMTSAGQSADVQMLYAVAQKSGLEAEVRAVAEADQLDADAYKTLIIAVGGSSKGLGAAGIDADEEKVRVQKIIDKFKDSTTIIVAHIGGEARRGELSDGFIKAVLPYAQYIMVVKGGDNDGLFTQAAQSNGIPMDVCESISEVGSTLLKAFK